MPDMKINEFRDHFICHDCFNKDSPCEHYQRAGEAPPKVCTRHGGECKWIHVSRFHPERLVIKNMLLDAQQNIVSACDELNRAKSITKESKSEIYDVAEKALDDINDIIVNYLDAGTTADFPKKVQVRPK
jgi:hypothetical protein